MGGWSTAGHGAARRAHFRDSGRGPLRWRVLFLAVLLPGAAWGEQTAHEMLKEMRDHSLWKDVGGCPGAERYLNAFPEGLHAGEARECLEAGQAERQVERLLEECEAHFAADRLRTGLGGNAVDCYGEVLSLDRGNRDALSGLDRVMGEYARRVRQALEGGRLERARGYLERMEKLGPASREVEELEDAITRAEREPGVYLTVDVLVGQQINSSHLETIHSNLIPPDEIRGYSMVRGGCYHRPRQAGIRLGWDDVALGCSP